MEDIKWDETIAKVRKKRFVVFGGFIPRKVKCTICKEEYLASKPTELLVCEKCLEKEMNGYFE